MMLGRVLTSSLAFLSLALPTIASAESDIVLGKSGAGKTLQIAGQDAVVYYLEKGDVFEVITTIAMGPDDAERPVRFQTSLADGEQQKLSIGGYELPASASSVTLTREHGRIAIVTEGDQSSTIEARVTTY
jgi:hypothetical protein